ncbi:hypothetical protein H3N56_11560 [Cetobacterium sp. 2A]|uniref:hypothetical protein n=1 Tax=Cetobacterium sp. 2A TaxID=2754723 RepID=UPI00163D3AE3|nr:hypothetical protein [Cetobacterium sp. 2A]MBC2857069.1 hypothetical protein [Cetobacterium sp. 2A]
MRLREYETKKSGEAKLENIINYDFKYRLNAEILEVEYSKIEKGIYPEIEEVFSKIGYDLNNNKITNIDEILGKWEQVYTKFLLCNNSELNDIVVNLNKYYRSEDNLEYILNNSLFLPYLKCLLNSKDNLKEIIFYNLLDFEELQFNISKDVEEYKDVRIVNVKGEIPSTFNFVALKKEMRDTLQIAPDKLFEMKITLLGKMMYEKEILREGNLEIRLSTNDYIEKLYKLEIKG